MCGIAGFAGEGDKNTLISMLNAISHRGPDDRGIFIKGNIGLGHNRLSIIDLSKNGKQPMFDDEKTAFVVLNGEIYNYMLLKKTLEKKYKFKSKTDTEVLLYAYKQWGINCLKHLNGMFSFVIYDVNRNLLFGARDRLGEKPLKYFFDGKSFAFSSEIKGLLPYLKGKPEIDPIAINNYLTCSFVPAPLTGFKKIFKLPAGSYFIFKNKKLSIKKYWNLSFSEKITTSETEWKKTLLVQLKDSIKSRLIADVPLGIFLSGGIDSSALVALIAQNSSEKIKTFTISFDDSDFDESKFAQLIAKRYRTDHKVFKVTDQMMSTVFKDLSLFYDEPFADNSSIPTIILSKFASKYVKVALTGDGGDENFAGYERYNLVKFANLYGKTPKKIRSIFSKGTYLGNGLFKSRTAIKGAAFVKTFNLPFYKKYLYYSCFFDNDKYDLYSKDFYNSVKKYDTFSIYKNLYNRGITDIDNALKFDIGMYLPDDLLFKTDTASMAYSLETRAPFLDHQLVELASKIPDDLKIKMFNKKYIFKKILQENNLVPDEIIKRKKRGFVAPIDRWMKKEFRDLMIDSLSSKKVKDSNIFNPQKLDQYLKWYLEGHIANYNNVFAILSLSLWINNYG